ncbi:sigma-54-dependent transcriptional regulator [Marinifilum caeruleilacunae]|uniref:Sigma-54-dependent Fis family transcriptional regulator n=1 Tax=Marinifilum caeruleilacunae TaxID=2499076 RepID=A0ABX1WSV9_9BACT|nr:sigma-54 dependent transcriptional regulator [Marinifilum caeruleilacunae]NOU59003.1 sigma-54-dependent Fis family transcriptional regulator [Marinifilum caeruleilacunae]
MPKKGKLLIVDDNEELLFAFQLFLKPHFELVDTINNPNLLLSKLREKEYDVIMLDMNFRAGINSGNEGLYWLSQILEYDKNACVVFITAYGDIELAVKAMKEGAVDFVQKSWDEKHILSTLLSAYKLRCSKMEIKSLKKKQKRLNQEINRNKSFVIGKSARMQEVFRTVDKVAGTDANILITGENGTGKEVVAREVHLRSKRNEQVFVHVDLGAISESLFESELFGHKKGAFTDAKEDRMGRFELASGGTLFLDEIGNVPLHLQTKLLTAIQRKEIIPVGGSTPIEIDVRIIAATNCNLHQMVADSLFREDLLYRINTISLELPSLMERQEDIGELSNFYLDKFTKQYDKPAMELNKAALTKLEKHKWPGNIRELQHVMEKTVILNDSVNLQAEDILIGESLKKKELMPDSFNLLDNEKVLIEKAIQFTGGNMSLAAKELGINRSTLYDKIKKYDL